MTQIIQKQTFSWHQISEYIFFSLIFIVVAGHLFVPNVAKIGVPLLQLLVLFSTIYIVCSQKLRKTYIQNWKNIPQNYKTIILGLALYFTVYAGFLVLHQDSIKFFDYPLRRLIFLLFIPFLLGNNFNTNNHHKYIKPLNLALIIGGIGALFISIYQYYGFFDSRIFSRVEGWYPKNPAEFGNLALLQGLVLFGLFHYQNHGENHENNEKKSCYFSFGYYLLTFIGVSGYIIASFLSGTRGGWAIFPVVIGFLMYQYYKSNVNKVDKSTKVNKILKIIVLAGLTLSLIIGGILIKTTENPIKTRINQAIHDVVHLKENANTSMGQRLQMWKMALHITQTKPVTGIGATAFSPTIDNAQKIGFLYPDNNLKEHADCHQEVLWNFVVGGSLLTFLWAYAFLNWLWNLFKNTKILHAENNLSNAKILNQTVFIALNFYLIMGLSVTWSMIQIRRDLFGLWLMLLLWLGIYAQQQLEQKQLKLKP